LSVLAGAAATGGLGCAVVLPASIGVGFSFGPVWFKSRTPWAVIF